MYWSFDLNPDGSKTKFRLLEIKMEEKQNGVVSEITPGHKKWGGPS